MNDPIRFNQGLIQNLCEGDEQAWIAFFDTFDDLIRSIVSWSKWNFSPDVQEEVSQILRTQMTKSIPSFKRNSSLEYFVKQICIHQCINEIRRQVRQRKIFLPLDSDHGKGEFDDRNLRAWKNFDPLPAVIAAEQAITLKGILESLDATCQIAIKDFYFQGLSYKEIADKQGISINTVGSRLAKCLEKLRKIMEKNPLLGEEIRSMLDYRNKRERP